MAEQHLGQTLLSLPGTRYLEEKGIPQIPIADSRLHTGGTWVPREETWNQCELPVSNFALPPPIAAVSGHPTERQDSVPHTHKSFGRDSSSVDNSLSPGLCVDLCQFDKSPSSTGSHSAPSSLLWVCVQIPI